MALVRTLIRLKYHSKRLGRYVVHWNSIFANKLDDIGQTVPGYACMKAYGRTNISSVCSNEYKPMISRQNGRTILIRKRAINSWKFGGYR